MRLSDKKRTIAEAARIALQNIGRPSSVSEIYSHIVEFNLYTFNTPVPEHVLRTEIRRKTVGIERVDSSSEGYFRMSSNDVYELMKEPSKRRIAVGMKRIQRATDKEAIIELLTSESVGVFKEIWRLLFFAAMIGFKNGRRDSLTSTGEGIRQESFLNNPGWLGTLYLLGLVETKSPNILLGTEDAEDERIKVFEEYANGGLAILDQRFKASGCSIDSLLTFIQAELGAEKPKKPDLQISI